MAILKILTAPNEKLKVKAQVVEDVQTVQTLIDDMLETVYDTEDGIGLAATQVGRSEAVVVIDISEFRDDPLILINPRVVSGENKEQHNDVWNKFITLIPTTLRTDFLYFEITNDENSGTAAHVVQDETENTKWNMNVNLASLYEDGKFVGEE